MSIDENFKQEDPNFSMMNKAMDKIYNKLIISPVVPLIMYYYKPSVHTIKFIIINVKIKVDCCIINSKQHSIKLLKTII